MNLLPEGAFKARSGPSWPGPGAKLPIALGAVLVAGSLALAIVETRRLDARVRAEAAAAVGLDERITALESLGERIEEDRRRLEELRIVEGRLARWDEERWVVSDLLGELPSHVGDAVVLENLRRRGAELWITGRTVSTGAARTAAARLGEIRRIRSLTLQFVERVAGDGPADRAGDHQFSLAGTLRFDTRDPEPIGGAP